MVVVAVPHLPSPGRGRQMTDTLYAFVVLWVGYSVPGARGTCPGDVNSDHVVDLSDLTTLLSHFGATGGATLADGDLDGNGSVNLSDLAILLGHFGDLCPEPPGLVA